MAIERLIEDDDFLLASWHNVLLRVGPGASSPARVASMHEHATQLASSHPDGIGMLIWLHAGSVIPDNATRRRASEMLGDLGSKIQCFAAVIEGSGFWASSVRSVLTGIVLVSRTRLPLKTFSTADDGAEWMAPRLRPPVAPNELTSIAHTLAAPYR